MVGMYHIYVYMVGIHGQIPESYNTRGLKRAIFSHSGDWGLMQCLGAGTCNLSTGNESVTCTGLGGGRYLNDSRIEAFSGSQTPDLIEKGFQSQTLMQQILLHECCNMTSKNHAVW